MRSSSIFPTEEILLRRFHERHGELGDHGWRVQMRFKFGYFDSDAYYEAVIDGLVTDKTSWIDVGGGKSIFPYNRALGESLAARCKFLAVVDPSDGVAQSCFVPERVKCRIEEYQSNKLFDLATLRMVAEHIERPDLAVEKLARLIKPGGKVVICTPNKWSPVSILAAIIPYKWHLPITRFLWQTKDENVFPTVYGMNTRIRLQTLFEKHGFKKIGFLYLDNCTTLHRFRWSCFLELASWRILRTLGISYPENNLLGVYEKE